MEGFAKKQKNKSAKQNDLMDTNVINALLNALSQQQGPSANNNLAITVLIFTSLGGLIAAIAGYIKARTSLAVAQATNETAGKSHEVAESAKEISTKMAENVQKIEISVNSERTSLLKKYDDVVAELGLLKTDLALSKQSLLDEIKKQSEKKP